MTIAWPKGLSWDSLMSSAPGMDDDGSGTGRDRFVKMPAFTQPVDWLPRRADRHPDAPPRLPIVASRDLPELDGTASRWERMDHVTLRPLPRSPEPWSEAQLDSILEILALTAVKPSEQSGKR